MTTDHSMAGRKKLIASYFKIYQQNTKKVKNTKMKK
jgi:hypothetical protein